MTTDKQIILLKKLKLVVLCLLIAFFNIGGFFFPDCPFFGDFNPEDAPESGAILLNVNISPSEERLVAEETKMATATVNCGADPCPAEDFFTWEPSSGPGVTAVVTETSMTEATLRFTADNAESLNNSGLPFNLPLFAEGLVSFKSQAEAVAVPSVPGIEVAGGGLVDLALFTSAEALVSSFPALGKAEVLFSPREFLNFGDVSINSPSLVQNVYIVNRSLGSGAGEGVRIDSISIVGGDGGPTTEFRINAVSKSFLETGFDSTTVPVQFFPDSEGFRFATLQIDYTVIQTEFRLGVPGETVETPSGASIRLQGSGIVGTEPPTVTIISPREEQLFAPAQNIVLIAEASDPDGLVQRVEFFEGDNFIGEGQEEVGSDPQRFTFPWSSANTPNGPLTLTAVATDFDGLSTTSDPVGIIVAIPASFPPAVQGLPWTSQILQDPNGSGPDENDDQIVLIVDGNEGIAYSTSTPDQKWRLIRLSDTQIVIYPYQDSSASSASKARGPLGWARERILPSLPVQGVTKHTLTITDLDTNGRSQSVRVESELESGEVRESLLEGTDEDGDGLSESANLEGFIVEPLQSITLTPEFVDVNDDGVMDFMGFPSDITAPDSRIYVPLADTNGDGVPDAPALDLDQDGKPDPGLTQFPFVAGMPNPEVEHKLYFAQFGDGQAGGADIFSQIILFNLHPDETADVQIILKDDDGNPLSVDLDGEVVAGQKDLTINAGGLSILRTDGQGPLVVGSVTVCSNRPLAGVILFGGSAGVAGVGSSRIQPQGFSAAMESNSAAGINTGIAVASLEEDQITLRLRLLDPDNNLLATAELTLAAMGHRAIFVDRIEWVEQPGVMLDFSNFIGLLTVATSGDAVATVIQNRPGEFATLPVAANTVNSVAPASFPTGLPPLLALDHKLYFAQFGDGRTGGANIFSQIILFNRDPIQAVDVRILLKNGNGEPLSVDLNGEVVTGQKDLIIRAGGLSLLRTDGEGPLETGSVTIGSNQPLAGVILFGGSAGVAGVGSSQVLPKGFVAAMESNTAAGINTGVAVANLEEDQNVLQMRLLDVDNNLLATAELTLQGMGHRAIFVDRIEWVEEPGITLDFSNFNGLLRVSTSGDAMATVIQSRPGVFATQPVIASSN